MKLRFVLPKETVKKLDELKETIQKERNIEVDQMLQKGILVPRRHYDKRKSNRNPYRVPII